MTTLFFCEFVNCLGFIVNILTLSSLAIYTQTNQIYHD